MKRIILILLTLIGLCPLYAQRPNGGGTYKYVRSFDANGHIVQDSPYPDKIMVLTMTIGSGYFQSSSCSYSAQNMMGVWPSVGMDFSYAGYNNGWFVFQANFGMFGRNFIYVYKDYTTVRVKMSYDEGKVKEYTRYNERDEIDLTPTY